MPFLGVDLSWLGFTVNLTKLRVSWDKGPSTEELLRSHWLVALSVRGLSGLMIVLSGHSYS